ncbi:MAG: hypothetical protein KAS66_13405 [Candidatus Omnitrophica bacterium]|nr:hypothetical protein [Candidatus Omnitrophota bacterium]
MDIKKKEVLAHLTVIFILSSFIFLKSFPLHEFNHLIFEDDYPKYLYLAKHHASILKNGALFGWNDWFSGGYPSFLELRFLGFLFLPFSLLGDNIGFHMMLFVSYVSIPPLIYFLSIQITSDRKKAVISAYTAGIGILAYFQNVIPWGLVPGLCSIPLFLVSWVFMEKLFKKQSFSLTVLLLTLGLLLYLHLYSFIITICFLFSRAVLEIFLFRNKTPIRRLMIGLLLLTLIAIPFIYSLWLYYPYIHFNRTGFSFHQTTFGIITHNFARAGNYILFLPVILFHNPYIRVIWMCLPVAVLGSLSENQQKRSHLYFLVFAVLILGAPLVLYTLGLRTVYLAPLFIALISGPWSIKTNGKLSLVRLLLIFLISSFAIQPDTIGKQVTHIKSINAFHPKLIEQISSLSGNLLLENSSHLNPHERPDTLFKESPFPHFEAMLGLFTKKRFLSHYGEDPYPYFTFREGLIVNGAFRKQDIREADINTIVSLYRKWNVAYLILWNDHSKSFFTNKPFFEKIFEDGIFQIFKFKNPKSAGSITPAAINIRRINQFKKEIIVKGARKNELIILRQNYTPGWHAYFHNKPIPLIEHDGQLSFLCPEAGNVKITLLFSRFLFMPLLIISALFFSFLLELKRS